MVMLFEQIESWHWLAFGLILLGVEAMGIGGFLIGIAIAALLQGAISSMMPDMIWQTQLIIFAVNALVFSVLYWKFFRKFNEQTDHPNINDRAASMIGRIIKLDEDLEDQGRIQIGDTFWNIKTDTALKSGTKIIVTGTDDMDLIVKKK